MTTTLNEQSTRPGPPLGTLLSGALADLKELGKEYLALGGVRLKDGARSVVIGLAALAVAGIFALYGLGELIYGIVGLIAARHEVVREQVQITTTSAVVCLVLAAVLGYVGYAFFKKAMSAPKALVRTYKEDPLWQKNPV